MEERRRQRSDHPTEAARLYLQAFARRNAHAAVALADADGLLVLGTPGEVDTEAVAAVAPLAAGSAGGRHDGLVDLVTRGRTLQVWGLELAGAPYFLAAVGGDAASAGDAPAALARILG